MNDNLDDNNELESEESLIPISGMYKDWFIDYASYVILERAVPAIEDGFKPVQRRILHSMKDLDDGRFNKVANIVGHTMQYHPHGDASISDAIVQIGQKDLLIETQGNWGNILTGDSAAASRYIEARLSKFALEVVYSPKIKLPKYQTARPDHRSDHHDGGLSKTREYSSSFRSAASRLAPAGWWRTTTFCGRCTTCSSTCTSWRASSSASRAGRSSRSRRAGRT